LPLALPVDCAPGETCFIQQGMDRDPGPGAVDHACGPLTYDGHSGTDIALPTLADMARGVTVRAAAAGTVRGVRDGMPDISIADPAAPPVAGRECGNGLVIDHGGGWETQYCHLRRGSLRVTPGQTVEAGTPLGLVGMSGQAEFPHLHLSVRRDGVAIDPFDPDGLPACGTPSAPLWDLTLPPGGIVGAGLADRVPDFAEIKAGLAEPALTPAAPALVVWAHLFGTRAGDVVRLRLTGPAGAVVAEDVALDRTQARAFRAIGRRAPPAGWPPGRYAGSTELVRAGAVLGRATVQATLGPP
jgi:hypothetical protein